VPLSFIDKRWKLDPFAYRRLKREIERLRPNIVHTGLCGHSYGRAAALAAGVKHVIAGERCVDPGKGRFSSRSTGIWPVVRADRHQFKRCTRFLPGKGIPAEKSRSSPTASLRSRRHRSSYVRDELLAELGLPKDARLIGAIAACGPQKRVKTSSGPPTWSSRAR